MTQPISAQPFPAVRATVIFTGLTAVLTLAASGVLVLTGHRSWIAPALAPALVCLAGALVSVALVAQAAKHGMARVSLVMLAGMAIRIAFVLAGSLVLIRGFKMDRAVVVPASLAWYIVLLVAETRVFARYFKSIPAVGAAPAAPVEASAC